MSESTKTTKIPDDSQTTSAIQQKIDDHSPLSKLVDKSCAPAPVPGNNNALDHGDTQPSLEKVPVMTSVEDHSEGEAREEPSATPPKNLCDVPPDSDSQESPATVISDGVGNVQDDEANGDDAVPHDPEDSPKPLDSTALDGDTEGEKLCQPPHPKREKDAPLDSCREHATVACAFGGSDCTTGATVAHEVVIPPRTPKRRRDASRDPDRSGSPMHSGARYRGPWRPPTPQTPFPSPRSSIGGRQSSQRSGLRRWPSRSGSESPSTFSILSDSPEKENFHCTQTSALSPSPKKKGKFEARVATDSPGGIEGGSDAEVTEKTRQALSRSPASEASSSDSTKSPSTPPPLLERAIYRFFEVEVARKIKAYTESPLADVTEAYVEREKPSPDAARVLAPPNTPNVNRAVRDW